MKNLKRILCLALCMMLSLLCACGNKTETVSSTPTNTTETVQFRISGRTAATASVTTLMEAIEGDAFGAWIVADKSKKNAARKKKRIHIRQETRAGEDGVRMLAFDVEFRCKERRFEK